MRRLVASLLIVGFLSGCALQHGAQARAYRSPFLITVNNYQDLRLTTVQPIYMTDPFAGKTDLQIITVRTRDHINGRVRESRERVFVYTRDITESRISRRSR